MECPVKPESGCTCTTVKEDAKMGPWSQAACSHVILALKTGHVNIAIISLCIGNSQ